MLSCVAYCGFAMVPSEEPFLPPPVVAVLLEVADLFLHVPEHASGSQASDHFLAALGFCFCFFFLPPQMCSESTKGVFCDFTIQLVWLRERLNILIITELLHLSTFFF